MAALTLYDIAGLIPGKYRRQILEGNLIYKAVAVQEDPHMHVLFTIWSTYVDNSGTLKKDCSFCLTNILADFKTLQPFMLQHEKEDHLLDEI